jgi:hypothetical protein
LAKSISRAIAPHEHRRATRSGRYALRQWRSGASCSSEVRQEFEVRQAIWHAATAAAGLGEGFGRGWVMARKIEKKKLPWPAWTNWALIAVLLTCILTIYATINDIY